MELFKILFTSVFVFAGTLLLFIGYREGYSSYQLLRHGKEATGIVVESYRRPLRANERTTGSVAPVVQFMTDKGVLTKYYSTTFTNFSEYQIGQTVKIWYSFENPQVATMEGKDAWILSLSFTVFGLAICLVFYPMFIGQCYNLMRGFHP